MTWYRNFLSPRDCDKYGPEGQLSCYIQALLYMLYLKRTVNDLILLRRKLNIRNKITPKTQAEDCWKAVNCTNNWRTTQCRELLTSSYLTRERHTQHQWPPIFSTADQGRLFSTSKENLRIIVINVRAQEPWRQNNKMKQPLNIKLSINGNSTTLNTSTQTNFKQG